MTRRGGIARSRPPRRRPGASARRTASIRWGAAAGVGLLVIVNIVLLALLLERPEPEPEPIASPGLVDEPIETPTPSPDAEPEPEPEPEVPATEPGQYVLSAVDGSTAWRATTGSCPDATAAPERTTDGGATWQPSDATAAVGITAVQRLLAASADQVAVIGYTADGCAPTLARTFVGGDEYSTADGELEVAWYVPADDRGSVHAPSGSIVDAPCASVTAIAAASTTVAAVLCADATVHATADGAETFTGGVALDGAQAIAANADGWAVALLGVDDCDGVAIAQLDPEVSSSDLVGCLLVDEPTDALTGRVALATGADTLWVWAGDTLGRSITSGASWL